MLLPWKLAEIANNFGINPNIFWSHQNGSTLSKISELVIADVTSGAVVEGQLEYDVISECGKKLEVRNMFGKACFAPSTSTGKGRYFELSLFQKKLSKTDSYIFVDLNPTRKLNQPQAYLIPARLVSDLYELGALGSTAHIDFAKRKVYRGQWRKGTFRFQELFDYPTFKLDLANLTKSYDAQAVISLAIEKIEKTL
jgi:hypothetical protein